MHNSEINNCLFFLTVTKSNHSPSKFSIAADTIIFISTWMETNDASSAWEDVCLWALPWNTNSQDMSNFQLSRFYFNLSPLWWQLRTLLRHLMDVPPCGKTGVRSDLLEKEVHQRWELDTDPVLPVTNLILTLACKQLGWAVKDPDSIL